jgi:hypothetical protein
MDDLEPDRREPIRFLVFIRRRPVAYVRRFTHMSDILPKKIGCFCSQSVVSSVVFGFARPSRSISS